MLVENVLNYNLFNNSTTFQLYFEQKVKSNVLDLTKAITFYFAVTNIYKKFFGKNRLLPNNHWNYTFSRFCKI